jgi:circadian clock protein KaiB
MTRAAPAGRWSLTLYVNGASPNSIHAIENARRLCEDELDGQVDLEIIDVQQEPAAVVQDQILAAPTLIKRMPGPLRQLVGDLSDAARVRLALDLEPVKMNGEHTAPGG